MATVEIPPASPSFARSKRSSDAPESDSPKRSRVSGGQALDQLHPADSNANGPVTLEAAGTAAADLMAAIEAAQQAAKCLDGFVQSTKDGQTSEQAENGGTSFERYQLPSRSAVIKHLREKQAQVEGERDRAEEKLRMANEEIESLQRVQGEYEAELSVLRRRLEEAVQHGKGAKNVKTDVTPESSGAVSKRGRPRAARKLGRPSLANFDSSSDDDSEYTDAAEGDQDVKPGPKKAAASKAPVKKTTGKYDPEAWGESTDTGSSGRGRSTNSGDHITLRMVRPDNETEMKFMKVSKTCPLRRLMQEWCKRYNEAAGDLTFSYNGEVILHADGKTPVSMDMSDGDVVDVTPSDMKPVTKSRKKPAKRGRT